MNMQSDIDKLTREIMREGMEEPSSSLFSSIMQKIELEKVYEPTPARKSYFPKVSFQPVLWILGLFYCLVLVVLYFFVFDKESISLNIVLPDMQEILPFAFFAAGVIGSLILYTTLDKMLGISHE